MYNGTQSGLSALRSRRRSGAESEYPRYCKAACPLCVHEDKMERDLSFRSIAKQSVRFVFMKKITFQEIDRMEKTRTES